MRLITKHYCQHGVWRYGGLTNKFSAPAWSSFVKFVLLEKERSNEDHTRKLSLVLVKMLFI